MFKISFWNISIFWFIKYIVLYLLLMFKNSDFTFIKVNEIKTGSDLLYYLWIFLFMPVISIIIFSAPVYFLFKVKNVSYFIIIVVLVLVAEYSIYTYLASQNDLLNGVYNELISVAVFAIMFFRSLKASRVVRGV
jgi:hypothetical protein